jgi:hypothetical protein
MRRWISLAALLVAFGAVTVLAGGQPDCNNDRVEVTITAQPQGGTNVNTLTCAFSADLDGGGNGTSRTVNVVWVNQDGAEYSPQSYTLSYADGEDSKSLTTTKSAPEGLFLDKTFHAKFSWTDGTGDHTLESEPAACTVQ